MNKIHQRLLALSILLASVRLFFPVYQQIYKKAQKLLTSPCPKYSKTESQLPSVVIEDNFSNQWETVNQPPRQLADHAEIVYVSGYEANSLSGTVKVKVDRPYRQVLLVLSSYEGVDWEVEASADTQITGIIYSSYSPSTVTTNLISTQVFPVDLPYLWEKENQNFVAALQQLNHWFDTENVDGFRGHYYLPGEIDISQLDTFDPSLTLSGYSVPRSANNFQFVFRDHNYQPLELTVEELNNHHLDLSSLASQVGVAINPDGRYVYQLTQTGIKISDRQTGEQEIYNLPDGFPELSWATDLAYDSTRDLVSLISFGGEGYFYRFDVENRRWLDGRSLNGIDLQTLTYDPVFDRYVAWSESFVGAGSNLWFISSTGELLSQENLGDRLPGYYRLYDRANEPNPQMEIIANGNNFTLIARPSSYRSHTVDRPITAIWHYNRQDNQIELSYKKQETSYLYSD